MSRDGGLYLYGPTDQDRTHRGADIAMVRLTSGEWELAVPSSLRHSRWATISGLTLMSLFVGCRTAHQNILALSDEKA